jgi:tripartite-type tricarboxylate transporter receptor subunit TctC
MMIGLSQRFSAALLVAGSVAATSTIAAEQWPSRPIRLIVPYAVGGSTDVVARLLAPRLAEKLGQQVVVDNRPGAAANIGIDLVAKSQPDGYTLGAANIALGANPSLFSKLPFDAQKDLAPVSLMVTLPVVLVIHSSVPAKTFSELIALAKAKPGTLNYSSAGNGSAVHLAAELLKYMTGTDIVHVPYSGGGPSVIALVGGQVSMAFASIPPALPHIKSGRLIALGVSSEKRNAVLPNLPTIAEAGLPGFEVVEWNGIVVAKGTPSGIIGRLNKEIVSTLMAQDLKDRIAAGVGAEVVGSTPEALAKHIAWELTRWPKVIKAAGIKAE